MKDTKNFKASEFQCKCGCGLNSMSQKTVDMLQVARDWKQKLYPEIAAIHINCGTRCVRHNKEVGGVQDSAHVPTKEHPETYAVDIGCTDFNDIAATLICLGLAGFTRYGFGFGKKYFHVDNDPSKVSDIWRY